MNVNVHIDKSNIKHVSVGGEVTSKRDAEMILEHLEYENYKEINITFFNANIIHSDLLERLYFIKNRTKCRIFVFKRYLYSYLYKLGISCEFMKRKHLDGSMQYKTSEAVVTVEEVKTFLESINYEYGYDYSGYQIESIIRRIKICMMKENLRSFEDFQKLVLEDEEIFEDLFHEFSINTTEFFRDPEVFSLIKNKILPYLDSFNHIKIWCAGCSNGKEVYSLTILLEELGLLNKVQIYATDINPHVIEEAKNGLFPISDLEADMLNYKNAGGEKNFADYFHINENYFKIKSYLKKNVLFFQHSLVGSGSLNEFTLILCRNVLIYFNPELQSRVLENFRSSLDRSGFLILGKSEGLILNGGEKYFTGYMEKEKIYKLRLGDKNEDLQ